MFENLSDEMMTDLIILFRILLAAILAFIPGLERELTGKFAGLRTHILVCVGSCVFTLLSIYGFQMSTNPEVLTQNDPARIAAQVITGIGFIGAGTVMRHGSNVFGITTAATLWVCAAIGMSVGCGQYITALIASFTTLIVLILIRKLEKRFISKKRRSYRFFEISLNTTIDDYDKIENIFAGNFHKIYKFNKKLLNQTDVKITGTISTKKTLKDINEIFKHIESIKSIEVKESYE